MTGSFGIAALPKSWARRQCIDWGLAHVHARHGSAPNACAAARQGVDFFGGVDPRGEEAEAAAAWEAEREADRLVVLSDVWLDRPATLAALHTIFSGAPVQARLGHGVRV